MIFIKLNPQTTIIKASNADKHIIVDSEDLPKILNYSNVWSVDSNNSVMGGGGLYKKALARLVKNAKYKSGLDVDHINQNRLDNRKCNLRICTHQQNSFNQKKKSSNTSGYIGVYWNKEKQKWCARIRVNGNKKHCGYFSDILEAARAYDKIAIVTRGEFAVLNFPVTGGAN